jgi:hypothetical protein
MIPSAKIPRSVRVGGETFAIRIEPMDEWGKCSWDKRAITLSPAALASRAILRTTLFHELTHAALMVSGQAWAEKFDEEPIVRALEHLLFPAWEAIEPKLRKL